MVNLVERVVYISFNTDEKTLYDSRETITSYLLSLPVTEKRGLI